MSPLLAIVPVLSRPNLLRRLLEPLEGCSSLERTCGHLLRDLPAAQIVVTTDSPAVVSLLKLRCPQVIIHDRSIEDYVPALAQVVNDCFRGVEQVVVAEPTHPFRPRGLLARALDNLNARQHLDSVFCVERLGGRLWSLDGGAKIAPLSETGEGVVERRDYFIEKIGLALATRADLLRRGLRCGNQVGFEVVDRAWTVADLHDEEGLELAQLLAPRLTKME